MKPKADYLKRSIKLINFHWDLPRKLKGNDSYQERKRKHHFVSYRPVNAINNLMTKKATISMKGKDSLKDTNDQKRHKKKHTIRTALSLLKKFNL